jgi:serine phosphatase RsbU (regulator of sigma subunit)
MMYEGRYFLLIVDDEQDFLYSARKHFERRGFQVETAADGIEALEKFEDHPDIDLVITDIRMPRMGGEELIQILRQRRPFLPILGVTGQPDLLEKLAFLDQGAYYFFDKPVERWEPVDRLVDNAIRLHHQEAELHRKRNDEREIAKMLRSFLRRSPISHRAPSPDRRYEVEVFVGALDAVGPSGDYVEWFERDGDELLFCAGDAAGHENLVPSFLACLTNIVLHRCHHRGRPSVEEIVRALDAAVYELAEAQAMGRQRYLTFFLGAIDLLSGTLTYVNAGHPEALLQRCGPPATFERLAIGTSPIGFMHLRSHHIEVGQTQLKDGDIVLLYTDGATELLGDGEHRKGLDHLQTRIQEACHVEPEAMVKHIAEILDHRLAGEAAPDDTTWMALRVREKKLAEGRVSG